MSATNDVKVTLNLIKSIFMLIFYVHLTGCIWFYVGKANQDWIPPQFAFYANERNIYKQDEFT